LLDTAWFKQSC